MLIGLGLESICFLIWHSSKDKKRQAEKRLLDEEIRQLHHDIERENIEIANLKNIIAQNESLRGRSLADEYSRAQEEERKRRSNRN
jgi:hypothetical protein